MATVRVRYWAGAQRAAGRAEEDVEAADLAELRELLATRPQLAKVIAAASFLVDETRAADVTVLRDGSTVDVLPPFAGG
jgi:molybdopterin converting factor small subunit